MKRIQTAWDNWGNFWTARSKGSQPSRNMRAYKVVATIFNIKS
jgi:hypothetical protein